MAFEYFGEKILITGQPEPMVLVKPDYTRCFFDDTYDGGSVEFYSVYLHSGKREMTLLTMIT